MDAIEADIVPLLKALGWEVEGNLRHIASPSGFCLAARFANGLKQNLWLDFKQAEDIYIIVSFNVWMPKPESRLVLSGQGAPPRRPGLWTRIRDLARRASPAEDKVGVVIGEACADIRAIDRFLNHGERDPRIHVRDGKNADIWSARQETPTQALRPG